MNPDGTRRFSIDERLTKEQVQLFISLAASNQQKSYWNSAKGNVVEVDDATSGKGLGEDTQRVLYGELPVRPEVHTLTLIYHF